MNHFRIDPHSASPNKPRRRDCILAGMGLAWLGLPASAQPRPNATPTVLVLGDSLSAGYGLPQDRGWVHLLQQRLREPSSPAPGAVVVNASISGDTTAGGWARLPALLTRHKPQVVVLALGSNDALRGLPIEQTREQLRRMIEAAQTAGARVLLAGMKMPPNYGQRHAQAFEALFQDLAKQHRTALLPFLLSGVADDPDPLRWFQDDRIHPSAAAQPRLLANVWPVLVPLLRPGPAGRP